jgi:murein DD-endopeptidase MepM/ murein hydrolase activator NlpD
MDIETLLGQNIGQTAGILGKISLQNYSSIDLSIKNKTLRKLQVTDPEVCQSYINTILQENNAKVAYGGYLEKRNLYANAEQFTGAITRNIHLGMDFWAKTGTKVIAPLPGRVHSFKNNASLYDYGPTIIIAHQLNGFEFYSLYGHLSLESLNGLKKGKFFQRGDVLGSLGAPIINVGYAPHLHFQFIIDLQGNQGNYPGVCSENDLEFYSKNCPNPNLLFKLRV